MADTGRRRDAGRGSPPSRVAQERLSAALRERAEAYRHGASVDLTLVEALVKFDEPEAAARTLDDHRASLAAMARDLQVVVADAAVEREAERVWEACAAAEAGPRAEPGGLRRRLLTLTSAAAMALVMLLPAVPGRLSPRTMLTSLDDRGSLNDVFAARERLEAARTWARALRADHAVATVAANERSATRSDVVRGKIRSLLAADDPGGSAVPRVPPTGTVPSLDERRASKASDRPQASHPTPPAEAPPGPLAPLDDLGKSGPRVLPLQLDVDLDPTTAAEDTAPLPDDVDPR